MLTQPARQILRPVEAIPAIGYIRVSAWFEEKISDEIQKVSIQEAAQRRGRTIVKWITDLDATGRNFKRKIMDAIQIIEAGEAEGAKEIWVWKYSRFGRTRHGVAINLARVEHAGGQLLSSTEEIDATTATGRFTRGMLFELAAFESDRIGEQWRETHEYRRTHGLPATGHPRFGYTHHRRVVEDGILTSPEHYEPDQETAQTVLDLYETFAGGTASFRELAEDLNSRRIHNPAATADGPWSRQALIYYMDCGFPAGLLHVHRTDVSCALRSKCPQVMAHYGFIPGAQPAIISDDLWQAYTERREQRKELPPRSRIPQYPYSGLTRCGVCGARAGAFSASRGRRGYGYRCTSKYGGQERNSCPGSFVTSDRVEAAVKAWLARAAEEVDRRLSGAVVLPKQPKPREDRRRDRIAAELAKIQKGLDAASMSHVMGDMPRDSYLRIRDDLTERREKLDAELAELKGADEAESPAAWEVRGSVVSRLLDEWDTLQVAGKRDLLSRALKEIRIFPPGTEDRVVCVPRDGFVI